MTTTYPVKATKDAGELAEGFMALPISRTDGKKGKSGLCIVVPVVSDAVLTVLQTNPVGAEWFKGAVCEIKSRIASALNKAGSIITDEKLGVTAILAAMQTENESQRMTKESIGEWFEADLAVLIAARIKSKMQGIADDKVVKLVDGYKAKFQTLSGRDVSMPDAVKAQLLVAMDLLPEGYDNVIAAKVAEKLVAVQEATETLAAL